MYSQGVMSVQPYVGLLFLLALLPQLPSLTLFNTYKLLQENITYPCILPQAVSVADAIYQDPYVAKKERAFSSGDIGVR